MQLAALEASVDEGRRQHANVVGLRDQRRHVDCAYGRWGGCIAPIVGPNGAGKSTALKLLAGLLKPSGGQVLRNGQDVTGLSPRDLVSSGMVFVPQERNIFGKLSVEENLIIGSFLAQSLSLSWGMGGIVNLGLAGALFGHFGSYVAPDMFQPLITIYIFLAVTLGGNGRPAGAVLGAYVLVAFLELTRFGAEQLGGITPVQGAAAREITVAVALLILMRLRPAGLLPELNQKAKP